MDFNRHLGINAFRLFVASHILIGVDVALHIERIELSKRLYVLRRNKTMRWFDAIDLRHTIEDRDAEYLFKKTENSRSSVVDHYLDRIQKSRTRTGGKTLRFSIREHDQRITFGQAIYHPLQRDLLGSVLTIMMSQPSQSHSQKSTADDQCPEAKTTQFDFFQS